MTVWNPTCPSSLHVAGSPAAAVAETLSRARRGAVSTEIGKQGFVSPDAGFPGSLVRVSNDFPVRSKRLFGCPAEFRSISRWTPVFQQSGHYLRMIKRMKTGLNLAGNVTEVRPDPRRENKCTGTGNRPATRWHPSNKKTADVSPTAEFSSTDREPVEAHFSDCPAPRFRTVAAQDNAVKATPPEPESSDKMRFLRNVNAGWNASGRLPDRRLVSTRNEPGT